MLPRIKVPILRFDKFDNNCNCSSYRFSLAIGLASLVKGCKIKSKLGMQKYKFEETLDLFKHQHGQNKINGNLIFSIFVDGMKWSHISLSFISIMTFTLPHQTNIHWHFNFSKKILSVQISGALTCIFRNKNFKNVIFIWKNKT